MLRNTIGSDVRVLPSLRRNESDWKTIATALATLYESGLSINWAEYHCGFGGGWRVLPLPAYQWDLKEYWIPYRYDWYLTKGDPLVIAPVPTQETVTPLARPFTAAVQKTVEESHGNDKSSITARSDVKHPKLMAVLRGHPINGRSMCPSSVYADMALTLFTRLLDKSPLSDPSSLGASVADMIVDKSLLLDEDAPAQWIELKAAACWSSRTAHFTLSSVSSDGQSTTEQHAKCTGSFTPKKPVESGVEKARVSSGISDGTASASVVRR
jgi:naphtho-gamma-pyrone polyketide synthase